MVLRCEAVAIDRKLLAFPEALDELEIDQAVLLVAQGGGREVREAEEVPPRGLRLTTVPLEEVGQQPAGLLLVVAIVAFLGDCLLYTSPSPRDQRGSRMPSSA